MQWSSRPVIVLGQGVRSAGAEDLIPALMDLGVPVLTSWLAADLVDSDHINYFGRPGVYGQRCANKVFAQSDMVLAIGCRLSIWTVGYDFPRNKRVVSVNIDVADARNYEWINQDAKTYIEELFLAGGATGIEGWRLTCSAWRSQYPWLESPTHDSSDDWINPHRFMSRLQAFLRPNEVIVADCATGSLCAHQILRLRPPQRLMTSGGLGEMGCGLPGAVGASFATGKGEVICLNTDGSMMLSLQELQTIAHNGLPVKIIVFCNDGYGMIKGTQKTMGYVRAGVDHKSGVSCPDFTEVAQAFRIASASILDTDDRDIDRALREMFSFKGAYLLQVQINPEYAFGPKLNPTRNADGSFANAVFDEMDPKL